MADKIAIGVIVLMVLATMFSFYAMGRSHVHAELLSQCKGPERGIRLYVDDKSYFYYCSYRP